MPINQETHEPQLPLLNWPVGGANSNSWFEFVPNWPRIWSASGCRWCFSQSSVIGCLCAFGVNNLLISFHFYYGRHVPHISEHDSCPSNPWKCWQQGLTSHPTSAGNRRSDSAVSEKSKPVWDGSALHRWTTSQSRGHMSRFWVEKKVFRHDVG